MKEISVNVSDKLYKDIERIAESKGVDTSEFIVSVLQEKVTLLKFGDLNDIMSKIELTDYRADKSNLIIHTNRGEVKIKLSDLKKVLPKTKKQVKEVEVTKPVTKVEVAQPNESNEEKVESITIRKMRIL